ncbi:hypothetical protein RSOLAG1IB_11655 [Rhizoctonia solani AG-1 IB]|uniref:Uncharacterized protein n=1 Tax=Thanatephorus cucumeris (strain AG1-IB / isolate 7/3/14) TaxID=1108050 RepID=A0A0B7FBS2_THACB|nr:hypothetical protein RSOLAG1IB_11655 [Rhizoctonia solani AG-1 IB]
MKGCVGHYPSYRSLLGSKLTLDTPAGSKNGLDSYGRIQEPPGTATLLQRVQWTFSITYEDYVVPLLYLLQAHATRYIKRISSSWHNMYFSEANMILIIHSPNNTS